MIGDWQAEVITVLFGMHKTTTQRQACAQSEASVIVVCSAPPVSPVGYSPFWLWIRTSLGSQVKPSVYHGSYLLIIFLPWLVSFS